ncbi:MULTISPECIES: multidrug effflux MFS transporter [Asticcacaulis]|uniref:multidrug effflux MFS transporter n=1 Tax=Asticcacaulis TaxID=76890 RepID=UPI001AE22396|nr:MULTISPECIES: multidrug effflux MFS transporter [Asticcacaulis]MBP2159615.1 DHA1 family bicyclomycin/chloramphenicol resistance-like MFS transporter [Asticcacaulis solisilvae]MDR6800558.1 DHA1 family bicyclomycin/chloramphenicol resistance-like MFS transporter [Asticcacaulis sp. BE141]
MSAPMQAPAGQAAPSQPSFAEFVALIASMMALGALGIDAMLPALPTIGQELNVQVENHLQWIVSAYFGGMGVGQLFMGVLSDWLGRKRLLVTGIVLYVALALVAAFVNDFGLLLVLRLLQGLAISATGVVTRSVVRDLYAGPRMAKVMSMSYVVFLIVPILAPSLGQLILMFAHWRVIFLVMAFLGTVVALWAWLRLPETLAMENRHKPDLGHLKRVGMFVVTDMSSVVYTLSMAFLVGSLLAYVSLMPQVFNDFFKAPGWMAAVFAACAATMAVGSMVNASLVEKLGLKRISHSALCAFILFAVVHFAVASLANETILMFVILQGLTMGAMSLTTSNFSAIAMEKVGHVAGTASSIQGVVVTVGGAVISAWIGQHWAGHVSLLPIGALICGLIALGLVAAGEKGKLFKN